VLLWEVLNQNVENFSWIGKWGQNVSFGIWLQE
jgi:hypothetical protein